jgi:hypothetical protein
MGRHTFKVGADVNHNGIENYFAGNARYTFNSYAGYFANNPASFVQAFPGPGTPGSPPGPTSRNWDSTLRMSSAYGMKSHY